MKIVHLILLAISFMFAGCATSVNIPPPQWNQSTDQTESEYRPYLSDGDASISGQAFLTTRGGSVIKGAGKTVTLDPATSTGNEWWGKAGIIYVHRALTPPSAAFQNARRTTTADADGRFKFSNIPAGKYYVRTEVTWEIGGDNPTQGGIVGQALEVKSNQNKEVILNTFAH
jgi:hypothetical protein